jgi:hypothetical protein
MRDFDHPQSPPGILGDYIEKIRQRLHVPPARAQDKSQRPGDSLVALMLEAIFLGSRLPRGGASASLDLALGEARQIFERSQDAVPMTGVVFARFSLENGGHAHGSRHSATICALICFLSGRLQRSV